MHEENIIERRNSKKGQAHNSLLAAINSIECAFENKLNLVSKLIMIVQQYFMLQRMTDKNIYLYRKQIINHQKNVQTTV